MTKTATIAPGGLQTITTVNAVNAGGGMFEYQMGGDSVIEYQTGGDNVIQYQTGGAGLFQSEDYNLMIPMDIHVLGTGINDMVVRIHKLHLEQAWDGETKQMDNKTSVDIQVGDAIRFVYNNNIIHAIVCGFKPGKDLNDDGSDRRMEISKFRSEYERISKTFESKDLKMSPTRFLSLTNLRGIKFLPFKYNDESYSYAPYDTEVEVLKPDNKTVLKSRNENAKRGLNGKFVFSCKDEKIPILPNGYKLPFIGRVKEGFKNLLSKLPFSTEVDIGSDSSLPQYSLPSYMTLEKIFVPPNFSEVITEIKNFRGDNPDDILKKLIKIMETNGLNDSNDCKKTSEKIEASTTATRKQYYQAELNRVRRLFNINYVKNGKIINEKGAIQFIKNLYNQQVKTGTFVDSNGNSMKISTKLVFGFDLVPGDSIASMNILLKSLSQSDVPTIVDRKKKLSEKILTSEETEMNAAKEDLIDNEGGGIQYGGAADVDKADKIIKDTVNLLRTQNFINEDAKDKYVTDLDSALAIYDPNEKEPPPYALSTSMVKSGVGPGTGFGSGMGAMGANIGSSILSKFFNKGSMGSSSSTGMGSGIDSCGNNTNIMCAGDDIVITVTLKINELIASCMEHKSIQNYGSQPGNFQQITNDEEGSNGEANAAPAPAKPVVQPADPDANTAAKPAGTDAAPLGSDAAPPAPAKLAGADAIESGSGKPVVTGTDSAPGANAANPPDATESGSGKPGVTGTDSAPGANAASKPDVPAAPAAPAAKPAALDANAADEANPPPESGSGKPVVTGTKAADAAGTESNVPPETARHIAETKELFKEVKPISEERKKYKESANIIIDKILSKINDNTLDEIIKDLKTKIDAIKDDASGDKGHKIIVDTITSRYKDFLESGEFTNNVTKIHDMGNKIKNSIEVTNKEIIANFSKSLEKLDLKQLNESQQTEYSKAKKLSIPVILLTTDEMKHFFISTVMDRIEKKVGEEPNEINSKLYELLAKEENPQDQDELTGGVNNNNNSKSKKNRKSNKNKTKKRKGKKSNSRKVKFTKVKKV